MIRYAIYFLLTQIVFSDQPAWSKLFISSTETQSAQHQDVPQYQETQYSGASGASGASGFAKYQEITHLPESEYKSVSGPSGSSGAEGAHGYVPAYGQPAYAPAYGQPAYGQPAYAPAYDQPAPAYGGQPNFVTTYDSYGRPTTVPANSGFRPYEQGNYDPSNPHQSDVFHTPNLPNVYGVINGVGNSVNNAVGLNAVSSSIIGGANAYINGEPDYLYGAGISLGAAILGAKVPVTKGLDKIYDAADTLVDGRVSLKKLQAFVPDGTPNTFRPSESIAYGQKYEFTDDQGRRVRVKFHSPDLNAAERFPGSNSGSQYTAQVQVGNRYLGSDGNTYRKPNNFTHIPLEEF